MSRSRLPIAVMLLALVGALTPTFVSAAETLPDWVQTGLDRKQLISERSSDNESAIATRAFDEISKLPAWLFESGPFATVEEAEEVAYTQARDHLRYICMHHHPVDDYAGWSDLLNTGYTWDPPVELVKQCAVARKYVEERQHEFGKVTGTMYNVYLEVPNDPQRLSPFLEHRRQTISRERTWVLGIATAVIIWECLCLAIGLRVDQWSKGNWRGRVLAGIFMVGTLPLVLFIA